MILKMKLKEQMMVGQNFETDFDLPEEPDDR
jgi:hypothetical protein